MTQSNAIDSTRRNSVIQNLTTTDFDLLIVGGGITGAGIARDAALRGLSVALVEAADFASGTSSRSSKLVHGGLRYLAQGDVGLVREAATERRHLRNIAPHLAQPIPFILPAASRAAATKLRTALWTFEKLGKVPSSETHEVWSRKDLQIREPALNSDQLFGAVIYHECLTEDSRLVLANLRSAREAGAEIINYMAVTAIIEEKGKAVAVEVTDRLDDATYKISGSQIINAAGPWVDAVRQLERQGVASKLSLTRGIHVVVSREKLPLNGTLIMGADDKRSIFAIPKDQFTYIGTTDTFYADSDYWPEISATDVDYLLRNTNRRTNTPPLTAADVRACWAGVRPLVAQQNKSPSEISRKDEVWTGPLGIRSIAGGKLTAYRKMAERIVDQVQETAGIKASPCKTHLQPLPGGDRKVTDLLAEKVFIDLKANTSQRLVRLYGTEARLIMDQGGGIEAEVAHAVACEGALTLEDYWVRRSGRAWFNDQDTETTLLRAADSMGQALHWSPPYRQAQIDQCLATERTNFNWRN